MYKPIRFSGFSLLVLLQMSAVQCRNNVEGQEPDTAPVMTSRVDSVQLKTQEGGCSTEWEPCLSVQLVYPKFTGSNPTAGDQINAQIEKNLISFLRLPDGSGDLQQAIQKLKTNFSAAVDRKAIIPQWNAQSSYQVLYHSDRVLSVIQNGYAFYGEENPPKPGAILRSFDLQSGRVLAWSDVISDRISFVRTAEKNFRTQRRLNDNENLLNAGYFAPTEGAFDLPANFAVIDSSLVLYYNPEEIAPEGFGPIECRVPLRELRLAVKRQILDWAEQ